jgi:nucleoside-diphosphate-sugar epimerase
MGSAPPDLVLVRANSFSEISPNSIDEEIRRLAEVGVRSFLHLAWPASSTKGDYRTSTDNFSALEKTLISKRSCERHGIKFFGVGTVIDTTIDPKSTYSLTKYTARQTLLRDIEAKQISWIRPYYVFDGVNWPQYLEARPGEKIEIQDNSPRDFIHLRDVVSGILTILKLEAMGEMNLGSGVARRPSDICDVLGRNYSIMSNSSRSDSAQSQPILASQPPILVDSWQAIFTLDFFGDNNGL